MVRIAIFAAIYAALFGYQVYDYMANKEKNLYEILDLPSPYVSGHQIDVAFDKAKEICNEKEVEGEETVVNAACLKPLKSAHKCLKRKRCRDQYTRYYLSIDLPDDPNVEIDWRLGFTIMFYMMFAYTQSVLGSQEQKPGTRVGMGLGIMFCIDEVMILQDMGAFI